MSVTIHQQPQLFTPVYNPMRFVLSSTNSSQDNFKYVVDVYVSGVSGFTRLLVSADPVSGNSAPDVSRIIESHISFDLDDSVYGFQRCTNSIKAYEVKFGEQYGPSSGITTFTDLTVTGTKYAWNGVFSPNVFRTFSYATYTPFSGSAILSNMPTTHSHFLTPSHAWQYMLNDTSGSVYFAKIVTYDSANVAIATYLIENPYQASSSYLDKMVRVGVGIEDLNGATLFSGMQPVITGSVAKYEVSMTNFIGNETTNAYTYVVNLCGWHNTAPAEMHFQNRSGGFDVFYFKLQRRQFSDITRDTQQKNLGTLSGNAWSYSSTDRGKKVFNSEIKDRWTLESDWISDDESAWLQELVESPEVFYHDGTSMIPVVVVNTSTEIKTIKNMEKLFNYSIEIEFANKRWTQRG